MAEKILNTRVLLKTDTLENWNNSTLALKKGEIAIATVAATAGTGLTEPVVMIKIGEDGIKTFKDLPWNFYAKSSDVLNACKSESALTTFINNVIAGSGIATDEALVALTNRITTVESDIDALEVLVGDDTVANQVATAIAGAKSELVGTDTDTAASDTIKGAKKHADSLNTAMDTRVDALETAIGEGGSVAAQITAEIGKLDVKDSAETGKYVSAVSETDGKITVTRADLPDYTDTYAAKTHTHAIADVTDLQTELDKVTTLIGSDASKSVRTIANEELAAQLIPETAKESLDTLQEIAAWIQSHPDDASAMNTRITALEGLVGDDTVSTQITTAIDALKNGDLATMQSAIDAAEAAIEKLNGTGEGSVSKAVSDAVAALDVEDTAVAHQFVTSVSETDGKIAVTRAAITTDDLTQGADVLIFDCGSSSVNV